MRGPRKALTAAVDVRSYSPMIGAAREERTMNASGSASERISPARSSCDGLR